VISAKRLKRLRNACGFTQLRLEQLSGVSRGRISLVESGLVALEPIEIRSLYRALLPELLETVRMIQEFEASPLARELTG
jgi:transcriptional regulator with XRE-family HTH domain